MAVGGVAPTPEGHDVVLMDEDARRGLVLHTSGTQALAIALHLDQARSERPPTRGLLERVVQKVGGVVVGVRVDGVADEPPHGAVLLSKDGRVMELDGRPSDALALAIGRAVPVFVAESVLSESGVDIDRLDFRKLRLPGDEIPEPRGSEVAL
jgi:bifunctional DNase/RNase